MSKLVLMFYRIVLFLKWLKIPLLPSVFNKILIRIPFACHIGIGAKIGKRVCLAYGGMGTVIHHDAVIGDDVYIGVGVVLGGTNCNPQVPVVEDNCLISAGAKLIGPVTVGEGSVVGANAVVVKDVPPKSVVVGIPAKVIKKDICMDDYR